jgi:hypothetical protein
MARKKSDRNEPTVAAEPDKVMVSRRLPRYLWTRVQTYVATIQPRTTDTAIVELALMEYLDRNEGKGKK